MATYGQLVQFGPYFSGGVLCTLKLYHYASGTTTLKDVYTDREKTTTAAQPVVSDAAGIVSFYADGLYKFRIDGSTDGVTYSTLYTYDKWAVGDQSSTLQGEGAALSSASTLTLGTDGNFFHVTGTTSTSAISGSQNEVTLVADAAWPLVHSGNLILQDGANYTSNAGDCFRFINDGAGVWREVSRWQTVARNGFLHDGPDYLENVRFTVSMSSSACTISLVGNDGNAPSTTNPLRVSFRSATSTTSSYVTRTATSAISVTIPSTATLGTVNAVQHRIYIGALDNAGTVELYVVQGTYRPEYTLLTTVAMSAAATSTATAYSTATRTSVAHRVLGYFESTQATAGTWVTDASFIHGGTTLPSATVLSLRKTADESVTSSVVLQNDDHLAFPIGANEEWVVDCFLDCGASMSVTGIGVALTVPSGATLNVIAEGGGYSLASPRTTASGTVCNLASAGSAVGDALVHVSAWVLNGTTAGTVTLQWCQATSSATTLTVRKGSHLLAQRVA